MNGFIYPLLKRVIDFLHILNLVVHFKYVSKCFVRICNNIETLSENDKNELYKKYSTFAIDIYQLFKWGVLLFFWYYEYNNAFSKIAVYYLILSNLFIYFYYHTWGSNHKQRSDVEALRKNFLNYLMAIMYYLFSYAYLYKFHYLNMIEIDKKYLDVAVMDNINAIYLSISTAFTLTYSGFQPLTQEIRVIFLTELINTFLFFTIIVSNSVPTNFKEKD